MRCAYLLLASACLAGCAVGDGSVEEFDSEAASNPADKYAVTCNYPVKADDTIETLAERMGDAASIEDVHIGEGEFEPGVVLWGKDPARRIDVIFEIDRDKTAQYLEFIEGSNWTVGGVGIGDTATQVQAVNGRPFSFLGFEWDLGGSVTDFNGGRLGQFDGECAPRVGLGYGDMTMAVADRFIGDVAISSDAQGLPADRLVVWRLGVDFQRSTTQ